MGQVNGKNDLMYQVSEARTRADHRAFLRFPSGLYRDDPCWVPPLWRDERRAYSGDRNPVLASSQHVQLLGYTPGGVVAGRNLVYIDADYNAHYQSTTGLFGALECIDDRELFLGLLAESEDWLRRRGMTEVRGPIHPVAENWGFQVSGPRDSPVFMAPYNREYYPHYMDEAGYRKAKDLLVYEANRRGDYEIPERFRRFAKSVLARRPGLSVRTFSRSNLMGDAEAIWRLSNEAYRHNWGYVPLSRDVMIDMARQLKTVMDPEAIWFVEDGGVPVGYCLGFPDVNVIIKRIGGRLFPLGFLRMLRDSKKLTDYRLFGLAIHPDYHGLGLDVLLYVKLYTSLQPRGIRLEANYILEDNYSIRNALEKLGLEHTKTYRVYEKRLV